MTKAKTKPKTEHVRDSNELTEIKQLLISVLNKSHDIELPKTAIENGLANDNWITLRNMSGENSSSSDASEIRFPKESFFQKMFTDITAMQSQISDITENLLEINPVLKDIKTIMPELKSVISNAVIIQRHDDELKEIKKNIPVPFMQKIKEKAEYYGNIRSLAISLLALLFLIWFLFTAIPQLASVLQTLVGGSAGSK